MRSEVAGARGNVEYQFYAVTPKTEVLNHEGPGTGQIDWLLKQFNWSPFLESPRTLRCSKSHF